MNINEQPVAESSEDETKKLKKMSEEEVEAEVLNRKVR